MRQIWRRHKLARALSKRQLTLGEPKTRQREAAHVCLDVLTSIVCKLLFKGDVVCHRLPLPPVPHVKGNHFYVQLQSVGLGVFTPLPSCGRVNLHAGAGAGAGADALPK